MNTLEKVINGSACVVGGVLGAAAGLGVFAVGAVAGGIAGCGAGVALVNTTSCGVQPSGGAEPTYFVNQCSDNYKPPLTFGIDCSEAGNKTQECIAFLNNTACKVSPAYQKITQIPLEQRCSALTYKIYSEGRWPYSGAGGESFNSCRIDYKDKYSIDQQSSRPYSSLGAYDTHELLHQFQSGLSILHTAEHPLFATSQLEAQKLAGDQAGYNYSLSLVQSEYNDFMAHPEKIKGNCKIAQLVIEEGLYLADNNNIYKIYDQLRRNSISGSEQALSGALFYVSGSNPNTRQFLLNNGCSSF